MRRLAALVLAVLAAGASAGDDVKLPYGQLSMRELITYRLTRADEARRRGDAKAYAEELGDACGQQQYLDPASAMKTCADADAAAERLGRVDIQAALLAASAAYDGWTGNWETGRKKADRALALCDALPPSRACSGARLFAGANLSERGSVSEGLPLVEHAVEDARAVRDAEMEAFALAWVARSLLWLGDARAARTKGDAALEIARRIGSLSDEINAVWVLALIEANTKHEERALQLYEETYRLAVRFGFPFHEPTLLWIMADIAAGLGRFEEAESHLAELKKHLTPGSPLIFFLGPGVDEVRGVVAQGRGDHRAAAELFASASKTPWAFPGIRCRLERARALRRLGDLAAAREAYEEAIRHIEETREKSPTADEHRASFMASHGAAYKELIAVLWETSREAEAEKAFAVAEAGRARALLDALRASGLPRQDVVAVTSRDVRSWLGPGELLLTYVRSEERLFGFAVSRDGLRMMELLAGDELEALGERVAFFRQLVQESDTNGLLVVPGSALAKDLLAPLLAVAPQGTDTLLLSLDEPLHDLPFDALSLGGASSAFVAERFDVVTVPSGSVLRDRRQEAGRTPADPDRRLLGVADPQGIPEGLSLAPAPFRGAGSLGPLPYSRLEVERVRRRVGEGVRELTGAEATEARVKKAEPGRFRVLHFATHALLDTSFPLRSCLLLGAGEREDGYLRASEIYALPLASDLVVLSACESGLGHVVQGEGSQSLARAFLHSGARAVVSTLWRVGDRSSVDVMEAFYAHLSRGESVGRALGAAKRELLRRRVPPRAWAGFVVSGAPDALARAFERHPSRLAIWIGAGLAIALLWVAIARTRRVMPRI